MLLEQQFQAGRLRAGRLRAGRAGRGWPADALRAWRFPVGGPRHGLLVLLLLLATGLCAQPQIYRWKDKKGKENITNTPPPPGAVSLDVPPAQGARAAEGGNAELPAGFQDPKGAESLPALSAEQRERWKALDQRLEDARSKKDMATIEAVVEGLFRESMWGNGLWAIPLLPLATLALLSILGWWAATGLKQPFFTAVFSLGVIVGLAAFQFTLSRFLYRNQYIRLRTNLEVFERHLGGRVLKATSRTALKQHYTALDGAANPLAPPWAFLLEARAAEDTMIKVALDP